MLREVETLSRWFDFPSKPVGDSSYLSPTVNILNLLYTVKPLLTDTIMRTPLYHGQFSWFRRNQYSDHLYFHNTDNALCTFDVLIKDIRLYSVTFSVVLYNLNLSNAL